MPRALFVSALAVIFSGMSMVMAADDNTPTPIVATLEKNANVRYGPSTNAKVVVTLKSGTHIEVFGLSKSSADWYVIRFPKEGTVWVDSKSLTAIDGGARYKVANDKTRAREDSRPTGEVVAELSLGEVVESKNLTNGSWRAVYIPDAVAYIHKSLVSMPKDAEKQLRDTTEKAAAAAQAWQQGLATYTQYADLVRANPKAAVGLDWASLATQLDIVIAGHTSASVRLAAKRIREALEPLVPSARIVAEHEKVVPPAPLPAKPQEERPAQPEPGTEKPVAQQVPVIPPIVVPPPSLWQAEGLLVTDDQFLAKVGTRDVLVDGDGNVKAFIKSKDGVDLKLSELRDRYVGAKGELLTIPPEQSGLAKPTKLIIASDVAPVRQ